MKKNVLFILLIFPLAALAQDAEIFEYPRFRLSFEAGVGFLNGTTITPDAVRESQSYYYDDYYYRDYYYCGYLYDNLAIPHYYIGVKPEFSINKSFALAAGLRLLNSNYTLNSDKDYFLWKISENDLTTHYTRVKNIKQNRFYVGVPVEITFYTYGKRDLPVRHYCKGGVSLNFLLASKTTPYFADVAMNRYADKVINDVKNAPSPFFTPAFFIGTGMKIGRMNRPFGTIEIRMPFTINASFSSFIASSVGLEFQTAIYFPLREKK